ncbi:MAG: RHS repeat-associated core domain-containing protein [Microcoleus sp. PH2017_22_RUC_O_B]|nr:RHS repeat-associated core domain-containing protein [Microcoleus sp. PH2017_21_RUC_O_A]MCC3541674.1 RHS repeat-associated core domain-containing protein [Microcoleus sp. PH2017_22_RUC_O_B]
MGYDSFGKVRSQTNSSVGFRFGFTGRELDAETGNYYYNSRYYDPQVGRFISEDTVGFAGGDANLYRYVGNSPTNYTDPSGEIPVRRWLGSDPSVYTGLAPWANRIDRNERNPIRQRQNQYDEAQRQWALQTIKNNAAYICDTANHYNVTPDAIAGAILWEALENPYDLLTRGQGPLRFTRPNRAGANDFGIPGKIHVKPGSVAEIVENRVRQRRPDGFPQTIGLDLYSDGAPSGQVSVPISKVSAEDRRLILLQRDPTLAIEYIGAILDREARVFEQTSRGFDSKRANPLGAYPIRDQAGLLTAFYQGVDPASGARAFEERRGNFQRTGRADLYPPRPMLPRENATMGPWVSQYRWWIRNYLNDCGCKPRSFTKSPILKVPYPNPGYPAP